jgi:TonB-linked SusC/RagA family outer membrane protein
MRRFLTLFAVLMFSGMLASAQSRVISGQIRDIPGEAVKFATVTETGTTNAVTSDANGNFSIKVKDPNATLSVSAVGYDSQVITPSGTVAIANLVRNTQELTTVVVTSLGQVRQKASLGFATATVKSKELTQANPVNLQNGLVGKVSGLNVVTSNSGVLGTTRITLRGIRSLTGNNEAMLILDGVPIALGYLNSINPNDIADVNILKSATATAIYGPEGVNGAIVVTTKRGNKQKPTITVSQATQLEKIAYLPKFQTRYGSGYSQDANGNGTFTPYEQQSWGDEFNGEIRQMGQTGPNGEKLLLPYSYVPNGRRNFFETGVTSQTDVSYSAGDFYVSAQNVQINGTLGGDQNRRRTITLRSEKEYNRFKAILNVRYTNGKYDITRNNRNIYYNVTGAPGQYDLSRFKNWRTDYFSSPDGYYTTYLSNRDKTPYFAKDNKRQYSTTDDIFGNIELNYKATNWLNFVYRLGYSVTNQNRRNTTEAFQRSAFSQTLNDPAAEDITAQINDAQIYQSRVTSEFFANFNTKYKQFGFSGTIGTAFRESKTRNLSVASNNLGFSDFISIQARQGEADVVSNSSLFRVKRLFGRITFDWRQIIFLEGTASYDRDSRLVPDDKQFTNDDISFFYPGASVSILMHKLIPGLDNNKILSYFKIRGAIAKTGNVNALNPYQNVTSFGLGTFFPYGSTLGYSQGTISYKRQFEPEFVNTQEVGIELGFLKNRINLEANYYNQDNTEQILGVQLSNTTGFNTAVLNAAEFTNSGFELDLKLTPLISIGKADIDFKVNYSYQTSEIKRLFGDVPSIGLGNYNFAVVGQPAYVFRVPDYKRDPATGKVIVDKLTGMPSVDPNLAQFGRTNPDNILGLNLTVNWKGFTMAAVAEYRGGNQIVADELGSFLDDNGISERSAANGRRAFVFPNSVYEVSPGKYADNVDIFTQSYGREFWNAGFNTDAISNFIADGSFWKLREVALNYTLPANLFKGNFIKGVSIGITGRNLLTWLPKSNVWTDPEFSASPTNLGASNTGNTQGRSTGYNLPPTRNFGANVTFQF